MRARAQVCYIIDTLAHAQFLSTIRWCIFKLNSLLYGLRFRGKTKQNVINFNIWFVCGCYYCCCYIFNDHRRKYRDGSYEKKNCSFEYKLSDNIFVVSAKYCHEMHKLKRSIKGDHPLYIVVLVPSLIAIKFWVDKNYAFTLAFDLISFHLFRSCCFLCI